MRKKGIPILIFIVCQLASVTILVLWIVWHAMVDTSVWWILQGIILMVPVIGGATIIFVYWTKSRSLDSERVKFISTVSHELLTPLASLRLYLETMMMRRLDSEKRNKFLQLMYEDSERLSNSISKILAASRLERGAATLHPEALDLGELVERFVEKNVIILKNVELKLNLAGGCIAHVDEENFTMVLRNLVENAIRYSRAPASITISLKKQSRKILLTVCDEGEGMEAGDLKKVFRMFYRASRKQEGTGIGLYIVHTVVKAHKGKVWAQSKGRGQGTCFHVLLPARHGMKEATETQ